jgi:hypothetical protein
MDEKPKKIVKVKNFALSVSTVLSLNENMKEGLISLFNFLFDDDPLIAHLSLEKLVKSEHYHLIFELIFDSLKDKLVSQTTNLCFLSYLLHLSKNENFLFTEEEIVSIVGLYNSRVLDELEVFSYCKLLNSFVKNDEYNEFVEFEKINDLKCYLNDNYGQFVHKKILKLYLNYLKINPSCALIFIEIPLCQTISNKIEKSLSTENISNVQRLSWILHLESLILLENDSIKDFATKFLTTLSNFKVNDLIEFFGEDDKFLMRFLTLLLYLYAKLKLEFINPLLFFHHFLLFIRFDLELCFEFLISDETNFLEYLMLVLKFKSLMSDFKHHEEILNFFRKLKSRIEQFEKKKIFPYDTRVLILKLKQFVE